MSGFHMSESLGKAMPCRASSPESCRFGGAIHASSAEAVYEEYEKVKEGSSIPKRNATGSIPQNRVSAVAFSGYGNRVEKSDDARGVAEEFVNTHTNDQVASFAASMKLNHRNLLEKIDDFKTSAKEAEEKYREELKRVGSSRWGVIANNFKDKIPGLEHRAKNLETAINFAQARAQEPMTLDRLESVILNDRDKPLETNPALKYVVDNLSEDDLREVGERCRKVAESLEQQARDYEAQLESGGPNMIGAYSVKQAVARKREQAGNVADIGFYANSRVNDMALERSATPTASSWAGKLGADAVATAVRRQAVSDVSKAKTSSEATKALEYLYQSDPGQVDGTMRELVSTLSRDQKAIDEEKRRAKEFRDEHNKAKAAGKPSRAGVSASSSERKIEAMEAKSKIIVDAIRFTADYKVPKAS